MSSARHTSLRHPWPRFADEVDHRWSAPFLTLLFSLLPQNLRNSGLSHSQVEHRSAEASDDGGAFSPGHSPANPPHGYGSQAVFRPSFLTLEGSTLSMQAPQTAEGWEEFLTRWGQNTPLPSTLTSWTRYTLGEYEGVNFAGPSSPPRPNDGQLQGGSSSTPIIDEPYPKSAKLTSVRPTLGIADSQPRSTSFGQSIQSSASALDTSRPISSNNELADVHPDISSSGPSNQDPQIPNIASENFSPSNSASGFHRSEDPSSTAKAGSMTTKNIRELEDNTARMADNRKNGSLGSQKRSRGSQVRAMKPEVAHAGSALSGDSSSDGETPHVSLRPKPSRRPTSKDSQGSKQSRHSLGPVSFDDLAGSVDEALLASSSNASSQGELPHDAAAERTRIRDFFEAKGYMPAPRENPAALQKRLRVIRRLGLEKPDSSRRLTLDRFTRLATNTFKTKMAIISVVAKDRQVFLSEIGFGCDGTELEVAFCAHTIIGTGKQCMIVPDASKDWRFRRNPLTDEGRGPVQFYAGAPLVVVTGQKSAIIGSLCVVDDKPREFSKEDQSLLRDLADCTVSEVSSLYQVALTVSWNCCIASKPLQIAPSSTRVRDLLKSSCPLMTLK